MEYEGKFIVTEQQHKFLQIDEKFYEPLGQDLDPGRPLLLNKQKQKLNVLKNSVKLE